MPNELDINDYTLIYLTDAPATDRPMNAERVWVLRCAGTDLNILWPEGLTLHEAICLWLRDHVVTG